MSNLDKYARQVGILTNQAHAILKEAHADNTLNEEQKTALLIELELVRSTVAQSTAALVNLALNDSCL